ncbi:MAG: hypothetical protein VKS61_18110 [Candidatus Sericytochromatia bacterium]|nr:hypothetical protein [Candidatus Sericytochromatia bacterium]
MGVLLNNVGREIREAVSQRIPVRPARFKAPGEVRAYVDTLSTTIRQLAEERKVAAGSMQQARAALLDGRAKADLAEGIDALRTKVGSTVRERRIAVAGAKEEIALAARRLENTQQPGAKLAAHYEALAASSRSDAGTHRMFASSARSSASSAQLNQNHGMAAMYNAQALMHDMAAGSADSDAAAFMTKALTHRTRAFPTDKAAEVVGRRRDALQAARQAKAAVERDFDAALAQEIPVLQGKLQARNASLKPLQADHLAKREGHAALDAEVQQGFDALGKVREGVPRGLGLLWVLRVKDNLDLGDFLAQARKSLKDSLP